MSTMMSGKKWPQEWKDYLAEVCPGKTYVEIATIMQARFESDYFTPDVIKGAMGRYRLKTGTLGQFKPGQVSHNKGLKQSDYMSAEAIERTKATRFSKGHLPHNHREIGDERITRDGYVEVKVAMFRHSKANDCWKLKHRLIWEAAHGEVPKGHIVIFLDGDKQNFALDNLALVSMSENARLNQSDLRTDDPKLTKAGISLVRLDNKVRERQRA